ncbi:MAG: hypothetical protein ACKVVP_02355 [Chloroflexota bacterium]
MDTMRFTLIDGRSKISFIGPVTALPAVVAACATGATSVHACIDNLERFQPRLADSLRSGLAVFDEHNANGNFSQIHAALDFCNQQDLPPFRVVDARTREASLTPVRAGVVLFNLAARRIVEIQNTYARIQRKGKVRVMDSESQRIRVQPYELPAEWSLVPER